MGLLSRGGGGEPYDEPRIPIPRSPGDWVPPEIEDQEDAEPADVDADPVALARRILAQHEVSPCMYCYENGDCRVRFWADNTLRGAKS